jgi:dihydroorotate dehydrogenase
MYEAIRPLLFRLEPERAHDLTMAIIRLAGRLPPARALLRSLFRAPALPVEAFGLRFRNPIGLAAGYDKDGVAWRGLACLGFGHIEIGTVTMRAQEGNPRPRVFRLIEDGAVINRMGFPGKGAHFVRRQVLGARPEGLVLGVNLGKNKDTPLDRAAEDYLALMDVFAPLADYLAINVSSPNTVGLRRLQARRTLEGLLMQLAACRAAWTEALGRSLPVLVKIAPDLNERELDDALEAILAAGIDGVIATNTTTRREGLRSPQGEQAGGLSGAPLMERSTAMIAAISRRTEGQLPIVGVGGVMNAQDARLKLDAGAALVQVYTGLIYAGPGMVGTMLREWQR